MKKFIYVALLALGVLAMVAPPAVAQDDKPFVIHGEFRFRGEIQDNAQDFDSDDADDSLGFFPYRARLAAEGRFGKNIGVWIEFQNASVAGGAQNGAVTPFRTGSDILEGDGAELYQASVSIDQLWSDRFSLRLGRQEIVAGTELHLGDLDFYKGISHDGAVGTFKFDKWNLMGFYTVASEGDANFLGGLGGPRFELGASDETTTFYGLYATFAISKRHNFDVYALNLKNPSAGTELDLMTFGGRYSSSAMNDNLFWNVEYATQSGDAGFGTPVVDAGGDVLEAWIGYKFSKNHKIWLRYASASGDDTGSAGENEGFIPLAQDHHNRLGLGDWFILGDLNGLALGATGITGIGVGYDGTINDRSSWGAAYWDYTASEDAGEDAIGNAIDVHYDYAYSRNLTFTAALSQLSPDDALTGGGTDDSARRIYGQARIRF